jgi:hypothetical protein
VDIKATAIAIASDRGWRVFPTFDKRPAPGFRWKDQASARREEIEAQPWEGADGYGIALPEGVVVVDLDLDEHGRLDTANKTLSERSPITALLARNALTGHCDTFAVRTRSGGLHLYFEHAEPLTQTSPGSCVDLRVGGRGYVIGPGSPGYQAIGPFRLLSFPFGLRRPL